jgi:RNA methyltransferase, TrmH family
MLSKAKIKYIKSLQLKKNRVQDRLFLVEGAKAVLEFINSKFTTDVVYGTETFEQQNINILRQNNITFEKALETEITQAGYLNSNNAAIALVNMLEQEVYPIAQDEWTLALDTINDPGNLGTIIRVADWYGIKRIIVSENSVDAYNPKVVNASKGSLSRVQIDYTNLEKFLSLFAGTIIGADMKGEDIHSFKTDNGGVLVMGSESHGISNELQNLLTSKITIPRIGGAESLNVGVATAIICDNLIGKCYNT